MKVLEIVGGFGLITLLLSLSGILRQILSLFYSLFVTKRELRVDLYRKVRKYLLYGGFRRWSVGTGSRYDTDIAFIPALEDSRPVAYRSYNSRYTFFLYHGKPVLLSVSDSHDRNVGSQSYIQYVHGTIDLFKLIAESLDFDRESKKDLENRFQIRRIEGSRFVNKALEMPSACSGVVNSEYITSQELLHWRPEDLAVLPIVGSLSTLSLSPELQDVVREARYWLDSKSWFSEHQIPWKHGFSFEGPPGTGKTAFTRALAEELDLPLFVFDLSSMTNRDLSETWQKTVGQSSPCVVLIEDIDSVFKGRENVCPEANALSFDCLLNTIDGVEQTEGILLIVTTNRPDLLDPALSAKTTGGVSSRPNRIDRVVTFGTLDENGRRKMAKRILEDDLSKAEELVKKFTTDTPAQFQDRCVRAALDIHWQKRNKCTQK